jgi:hypothetical protein
MLSPNRSWSTGAGTPGRAGHQSVRSRRCSSRLNPSLVSKFDGYVAYTQRLTRFGGAAAGLVAAVLGFVALPVGFSSPPR